MNFAAISWSNHRRQNAEKHVSSVLMLLKRKMQMHNEEYHFECEIFSWYFVVHVGVSTWCRCYIIGLRKQQLFPIVFIHITGGFTGCYFCQSLLFSMCKCDHTTRQHYTELMCKNYADQMWCPVYLVPETLITAKCIVLVKWFLSRELIFSQFILAQKCQNLVQILYLTVSVIILDYRCKISIHIQFHAGKQRTPGSANVPISKMFTKICYSEHSAKWKHTVLKNNVSELTRASRDKDIMYILIKQPYEHN